MDDLHLLYATVGTTAVGLALISRPMRRLPFSEPLVALTLGVLLGPALLGVLTIEEPLRTSLLLETSRVLLAFSVMAAALRFPLDDLRRVVRPWALLVAVVMPLMAAVSGAAGMVLGLPLALAAVLGACLAPTDPVLAAAVVSGDPAERTLPGRVRALLTGESGANDGLALPLVGLAVAAALPASSPGEVLGRLVWEVVVAVGIGAVCGAAVGRGVRWAAAKGQVAPGPELVLTLLLALSVLGLARLAQGGGVLAVFVAGIAYNALSGDDVRETQDEVDEAVNRYAVLPFFVLVGAVLPWSAWRGLGWQGVLVVAVLLAVRRLPSVLALSRPLGLRRRDAVFVGWFGPMGVSAVFYLAHSRHEGVEDPRVFAIGMLAVAVSVVAYGVSASPGVARYGRAARAAPSAGV